VGTTLQENCIIKCGRSDYVRSLGAERCED